MNYYDIATLIYNKYGYLYKCTSIHSNQWFKLCNNRWSEIPSPIDEFSPLIDSLNIKRFAQYEKTAIMDEFANFVYNPSL
ncbi:hypothetical protein QKU48_gp1044 [Fadolivirus algeromassiliense]|jgi:hypothetical protein|uniref:Uncharacterized protein n=1 Tax=Fadolivirus FV1/VV64 TaxID=3070911 RepID=A0A7D3R1H3_9VIRU|nr:hypothetical protein QKU48_gp1044 [Fadolivirus algeromassiliense]QKF94502.1 hypothetical protein Fadolivirus_1_1044 [Fadolivirus FV1/VV64]